MPRTTPDKVIGILRKDYDDKCGGLDPFVESASALVDDTVACAAKSGTPIDSTRQELIERWVAAYLYALSDKPYASKSTSGASASFQVSKEATNNYKEAAVKLDPSGCLEALLSGMRQEVGVTWLGKSPREKVSVNSW